MAKAKAKKSSKSAAKPLKKKVVVRVARAKAAVRRAVKKVLKPPKKAAAKAPAKPAKAVPPPPPPPVPKPVEKKRTRRSRPRVTSSGPPSATWFSQGEKPRPSSFIPAPPRAAAPSLSAAPPASSDRLVSSHELTEFVTRTVPVRVDVEAGGGRVFLSASPEEVTLHAGEGIEWDFRYLGGADVIVDELVIEFEKPTPFHQSAFRSRRPGTARPHRQLSGAVNNNAVGKKIRYAIKAISPFKTEMAVARPYVTVVGAGGFLINLYK